MSLAQIGRRATKAAALPAGVIKRSRPGDVVILLYHRIGAGGSEIELSSEAFERHLEHLSTREHVVSLDDALDDERGGVVVTFDDGYADFYTHALPLLERYRIPAVLYLATSLVDPRGEDPERLTWGQLEEAVSTGLVTIGSHTHNHVNLATISSNAEATEEMISSKAIIEDRLQIECNHFAYPWAVSSPAAEHVARQIFTTAALLAWKTNRRGRIDPYRLGRVPILASDGDVFFRAKVRGGLDGEAVFYKALKRGPWREPNG
ncbi:MAG: polysaccharide deacetylase family protein [Actinomycetota bacterium]